MLVAVALLKVGCRSPQETTSTSAAQASASATTLKPPPGHDGLMPVPLPAISGMEAPVRRQMETRFASLTSIVGNRNSTNNNLAAAYGDTGKLLMAAAFLDAAEVCYLNAQTLTPDDRRWPYYLGHVYKGKGPIEKSVASFERALQLAPSDLATMIWLGDGYLTEGRDDSADQLFAKAAALQPTAAAARFGEGRAALAGRDYRRAVDQLTEALRLDPQATKVHYQLAMAYRGLGDLPQSQAHLAQQGDREPRPVDPLMRDIDGLLESAEAYNLRGGAELDAGHWEAAAAQFRKGLELSPNESSLRHRLGTALYQMGDTGGAAEEFEQVLQTSPDYSRAHFSLGVLSNGAGNYPVAVEHFGAALKSDPNYVEARVQLAGVLARRGKPGEAVVQYTKALESEPTNSDAAFGRAMAFVRLHRYIDARDALADGMKNHPDQPMFAHALARLLAAAPDDRIRDGRRALTLIDQLIKGQQSLELAETTAMALAESGRYREAISVQRDALTAATNTGPPSVENRISANLRLYESGKPCRTPFEEDELP